MEIQEFLNTCFASELLSSQTTIETYRLLPGSRAFFGTEVWEMFPVAPPTGDPVWLNVPQHSWENHHCAMRIVQLLTSHPSLWEHNAKVQLSKTNLPGPKPYYLRMQRPVWTAIKFEVLSKKNGYLTESLGSPPLVVFLLWPRFRLYSAERKSYCLCREFGVHFGSSLPIKVGGMRSGNQSSKGWDQLLL